MPASPPSCRYCGKAVPGGDFATHNSQFHPKGAAPQAASPPRSYPPPPHNPPNPQPPAQPPKCKFCGVAVPGGDFAAHLKAAHRKEPVGQPAPSPATPPPYQQVNPQPSTLHPAPCFDNAAALRGRLAVVIDGSYFYASLERSNKKAVARDRRHAAPF